MPKRSAGCFECRKRKVRCDETKPECNTCLRRGTKCPGYRPTQSFILHQFDEQAEKPSLIKEDDNRYRYANHKAADVLKSSTGGLQTTSADVVYYQRYDSRRFEEVEFIPMRVSPVAIERVQTLGTFLDLYMPKDEGQALPPPTLLMLSLPSVAATSQNLLSALDALSAAQLAVAHQNYNLINRARSFYATALAQMMEATRSPQAFKDETLLSTYLLTLYEVFVGIHSGHGFFYHVQGLLHQIKQRGPESFKTGLSMMVFHAVRYNSLSIGYHMRKASMLDSPRWLTVTAASAKEDLYVALVDICIGIPRLLERADKLPSSSDSNFPDALESILDDSLKMAKRAEQWFAEFEKNGPRYDKVSIDRVVGFFDVHINDDRTFDPVFYFHNFGAGICYMIYSMSMLIMQSNTFRLLRQHRQLEPRDLFMWDQKLGKYADAICRSVPYNCRPVAGYVARFGTLIPLMVARKYFEAKKAEKQVRWCERVYQGARVPGLYSTPIPMEPTKSLQNLVQKSDRYL